MAPHPCLRPDAGRVPNGEPAALVQHPLLLLHPAARDARAEACRLRHVRRRRARPVGDTRHVGGGSTRALDAAVRHADPARSPAGVACTHSDIGPSGAAQQGDGDRRTGPRHRLSGPHSACPTTDSSALVCDAGAGARRLGRAASNVVQTGSPPAGPHARDGGTPAMVSAARAHPFRLVQSGHASLLAGLGLPGAPSWIDRGGLSRSRLARPAFR
jgi:hypothetical protein